MSKQRWFGPMSEKELLAKTFSSFSNFYFPGEVKKHISSHFTPELLTEIPCFSMAFVLETIAKLSRLLTHGEVKI